MGNAKQKDAYKTLKKIQIIETLKDFDPILVGTVPIDIYLPESDLDIICEVYDFDRFEEIVTDKFGNNDNFKCYRRTINGLPRFVSNFTCDGWLIEIFAQVIPTIQQNGFKHMSVEDRILNILGDSGRLLIKKLKNIGLKTEPAFARMLKLKGDPYELLIKMYDWEEDELINYLRVSSDDIV